MDNFTYHYYDNTGSIITYSGGMPLNATNKLAYVGDAAGATNYTTDIDNQTTTTNYEYDDIGNLVKDVSEEIYDIDWYANGKIHSIRRTATSTKSDLEFIYDAGGNRIVKIVKPRDGSGEMSQLHWTYTYYVRDAQGNVLAVYERTYAASDYGSGYYDDKYKLTELDIYSSKRLGILYADTMQYSTFNDASFTDTHGTTFTEGLGFSSTPVTCHGSSCVIPHKRTLGHKAYEVTNHLGNVLETVSDRKLPYDSYSYTAWSSGTKYAYDAVRNTYYQSTSGTYQRTTSSSDSKADYYLADVRSYSDYYAFGAQMDGRFGGSYRYDFNGKETDAESDLQDYGMRIYNARLGKFLSVDPLTAKYPELTPYQFASNRPIDGIDQDGLEWQPVDGNGNSVGSNATNIASYKWVGWVEDQPTRQRSGRFNQVVNSSSFSGYEWNGQMYRTRSAVPFYADPNTVTLHRTPVPGTVAEAYVRTGNSMDFYKSDRTTGAGWSGYVALSQHNIDMIATLHPLARDLMTTFVLRAQIEMLGTGNEPYITDGFRSYWKQDNLYAQGRTQQQLNRVGLNNVTAQPSSSIVTNARGGYSNHNFGFAIDLAGQTTTGRLTYDIPYARLGVIAGQVGLDWGGNWTGLVDRPHFEYRHGQTLAQLRALPTGTDGFVILPH